MDARDSAPVDCTEEPQSAASGDGAPRGWLARIGICLLNLLGPGLGLLRLGAVRRGLTLLALGLLLGLGMVAVLSIMPDPIPRAFLIVGAVASVGQIGLILYAIVASWRQSLVKIRPLPHLSRWYGLIALLVAQGFAADTLVATGHSFYKPFYAASAAMAPTLGAGDRFIADMDIDALHRGDVVMFDRDGHQWTFRLIGMPGDRIAIVGNTPVIDGVRATQVSEGTIPSRDGEARLFRETLPGSERSYRVADGPLMPFGLTDMPEIILGPDQYFLLGDNRDNAADSRLPSAQMGAGLVDRASIVGVARFVSWKSGQGLSGEAL